MLAERGGLPAEFNQVRLCQSFASLFGVVEGARADGSDEAFGFDESKAARAVEATKIEV